MCWYICYNFLEEKNIKKIRQLQGECFGDVWLVVWHVVFSFGILLWASLFGGDFVSNSLFVFSFCIVCFCCRSLFVDWVCDLFGDLNQCSSISCSRSHAEGCSYFWLSFIARLGLLSLGTSRVDHLWFAYGMNVINCLFSHECSSY